MSMNLHCDQVDLWQTPTWVTYMCTVDSSGQLQYVLNGPAAKAALYRYLEWVQGTLNGVWKNRKELGDAEVGVNYHRKEVLAVINDPNLSVSIM